MYFPNSVQGTMCFLHGLVFCALFTLISAKNEQYMGNKVYNIKLSTQEEQDKVKFLKNDQIDFLRTPSFQNGIIGRVMVEPSQIDWFEEKLREIGIDIDIHINDVFEYLKEKEATQCTLRSNVTRNFGFNGYYRYDDILEYLNTLANTHSSMEIVQYGVTEQNRTLMYVRIATNPAVEKPIVIIEGGINPREWITIPAAVNVVNNLFESEQARFLENYDWIVIPVVNPDGYEYTHTDLRLWTKTLTTSSNLGFICPGVNVNRNFDVEWSVSDSSTSPCSHLYAGVEPYSEIETRMVRDIIEEYGSQIRLYVSLQNNGGFITYPWQYERAATGMFRRHHFLGLDMVEAAGADYVAGVGSLTLDTASGTSSDFAQKNGVLYSFNVNLRQSDDDGVIIPEDQIASAVDDIWRSIVVAADALF